MNQHLRLISYCTKFFALLMVCLASVFVVEAQTGNDTESLKKKIRDLNKELEDVFNKNDMSKTAAFYADDAEIVYDNGYVVKGRANLDSYWAALKDKGRGWKLTVVEIGGGGEFVFQLGNSDLKYIDNGKETSSITNFVLLWRRQADGSYKIFRDYITATGFVKK
jgi:ketosteroid isomerase-like protein